MEILNVRNTYERAKMLDLCMNLWEKKALIPVLGAGFSFGTPTDNNGRIPSVNELRNELFGYIRKYSKYDVDEIDDLAKLNLSDLASSFWDIFERIPEDKKQEFFSYISMHFTDNSFFKDFQRNFLEIRWPYLFTLNYDSLIESFGKRYFPVIPYDKINKYHAQDKTKVFKLHGDAGRYLATGDSRYLILSRDQYVLSMLSDANKDMFEELLTTFSSKSILFFGCGLSDELDLLYSSQTNLSAKAKSIDAKHQSIIYINFESEDSIVMPLSQRKMDILSRYGVTTVFRFSSENETTAFFDDMKKLSIKVPQSGVEDFLERYSAMQYTTLQINDTKCRDFLFQENRVWEQIENHTITLPGYYVNRDILPEIITYVSSGEPICFISGNFFSGKTFVLLEIAQHFSTKKVYIFPTGTNISEPQLEVLLKKENALFCFDSKSLSTGQIKEISKSSNLLNIKKQGSGIVIVIDKSDAPMYKYIFEARNVDREFKLFPIESKFSLNERKAFNNKIGPISLPPHIDKETLLDYVVHNEQKLLGSNALVEHFLEPQRQLLSKDTLRRIRALIMLATEIRIPAKRAIQFKIDEAINDIIELCGKPEKSSVIEKDFSVYNGDSSGYEYVCNSKYWIIRALSVFAKESKNSIDFIADAYLEIVKVYKSIYKDNDVLFYQKCEPYYFFDHIQLLFNQRWFSNSTKLMNAIYDKLLLELSGSHQFMHQKAKGKLVIAQTQIKSRKFYLAKKTLGEAIYNITRAQEIARQYPNAKHIEETLLHMDYTAGRIFIEYSGISMRYIPRAVDVCYELYLTQQQSHHDLYDFATAAGEDKKAFNEFKSTLMYNTRIREMPDLDWMKVEYLLSRWLGRKVAYSRKKLVKSCKV